MYCLFTLKSIVYSLELTCCNTWLRFEVLGNDLISVPQHFNSFCQTWHRQTFLHLNTDSFSCMFPSVFLQAKVLNSSMVFLTLRTGLVKDISCWLVHQLFPLRTSSILTEEILMTLLCFLLVMVSSPLRFNFRQPTKIMPNRYKEIHQTCRHKNKDKNHFQKANCISYWWRL